MGSFRAGALVSGFPNTQHVPVSLWGVIFTLHQHLAVSGTSVSCAPASQSVVLPGCCSTAGVFQKVSGWQECAVQAPALTAIPVGMGGEITSRSSGEP